MPSQREQKGRRAVCSPSGIAGLQAVVSRVGRVVICPALVSVVLKTETRSGDGVRFLRDVITGSIVIAKRISAVDSQMDTKGFFVLTRGEQGNRAVSTVSLSTARLGQTTMSL